MGRTASIAPVGDAFDVDYVAHEMGHQFGADHTFNANASGACFRWSSTAYEPGSGSTILAYAGICDSQDLQLNSDDYFHGNSFDEIRQYVTTGTGATCGSTSATGNAAPVVNAGANYTIPANTPFMLNGSAIDTSSLTYGWEEFDLGNPPANEAILPNTDNDGQGPKPIFRSLKPVTATYRNFPAMTNILDNSFQNKGETLPKINRTMVFRLTARDGSGGVGNDAMTVTVSTASGPFRVTTPVGGESWDGASRQTATWNVANTTAPPVNCINVNIFQSADGGQTFPYTLTANSPNDGSESVTVANVDSTNTVIKVACSNNIFFDATKLTVKGKIFKTHLPVILKNN